MFRKALLVCGILSSLLYVAMNIFVAMRSEGYSSVSQTISELSAVGAPTRPLWVLLGLAYTLLVVAFGWGVWKSAHRNHALRVAGGLIAAYGAIGIGWPFGPMHQRVVLAAGGGTLSDTMHIVFSIMTGLTVLPAMGFGAAALGNRFRFYSIATIAIFIVFIVLTGLDGPRVAANLPTPWVGVWERIFLGVFLLWIAVLAVVLLCAADTTASEPAQGSTMAVKNARAA
jgi:hypothetical protein